MNLHTLATTILMLNRGPMSRIRFSRTIYFVHKELVRKGIMKNDDIAYLRLPLGPVPEGFMTLTTDFSGIIARKVAAAHLSYEAEEYSLTPDQQPNSAQNQRTLKVITRILSLLQPHSTPELVEASHDHSWQNHPNGSRYYLTATDLKNTFPLPQIRLKVRIKGILRITTKPNEQGLLQANLIRGMLTDIVQESTDLEYPDQPQSEKTIPAKARRRV